MIGISGICCHYSCFPANACGAGKAETMQFLYHNTWIFPSLCLDHLVHIDSLFIEPQNKEKNVKNYLYK